MVEPGLRASNRTLLLRNMFWDPAAGLENNGAGLEQMIAGKLFVFGLECVGHFLAYVAHFVLLRDVWIPRSHSHPESWRSKQARY
jgi:hypothetical protein